MSYKDLSFLQEINDYAKTSEKFDNDKIDELHYKILANFQLNERLMQLHWFIMQIASEADLETVGRLTLNAFFGLLSPRACSLYLTDNEGKPVEYSTLGKTNCIECDECKLKDISSVSDIKKINSKCFEHVRTYPLLKRNGDILGYLVAYFQGDILDVSDSSQLFLDIFTVQVGLAIEGVVSQAKLEALAYTDELTGLANKRVLVSKLEEELIRVYQSILQKQENKGVGFILFDVDNFKHYNDNYGHVAGDAVLKKIGKIISDCSSGIATGARYGGEELCVITQNASIDETYALAEKIRKEIESTVFEYREVTVSGGITHYPTVNQINVKKFMNTADIALYSSKNTGKNKISRYIDQDNL